MNLFDLLEDGSVRRFRRMFWWEGYFLYLSDTKGNVCLIKNGSKTDAGTPYCLSRDEILADDWEPVILK